VRVEAGALERAFHEIAGLPAPRRPRLAAGAPIRAESFNQRAHGAERITLAATLARNDLCCELPGAREPEVRFRAGEVTGEREGFVMLNIPLDITWK
jgi:hypothetical protein